MAGGPDSAPVAPALLEEKPTGELEKASAAPAAESSFTRWMHKRGGATADSVKVGPCTSGIWSRGTACLGEGLPEVGHVGMWGGPGGSVGGHGVPFHQDLG